MRSFSFHKKIVLATFFFLFLISLSLFNAEAKPPTDKNKVQLTFTAPAQITSGQPLLLSWSALGPANTTCIASGGWVGNKSLASTETLYPKSSATFVLDCRGSTSQSTTTKSVFVEVLKILPSPIAAFPGAEGFGSHTPGGRGGRVIEVTNLNDSGPGSFRDAVASSGPRIVVFRVNGTINTCIGTTTGAIWVSNPYITIAGQTAPGQGITLRLDPSCYTTNPTVIGINTHDVIMRHIRIRAGKPGNPQYTGAAINFSEHAENVVLDHLSLSWATDQLVGISRGAHDITIQWSIMSEPLGPTVTGDAYGPLIADDPGFLGTGDVTLHHNLMAHTHHRNPQVNMSGMVDIVNNVIYNYKESGTLLWTVSYKPSRANIVGNYAKSGPSTLPEFRTQEIVLRRHNDMQVPPLAYVYGNIGPKRPVDTLPQSDSITCLNAGYACATNDLYSSATRLSAPPVTTTTAGVAYNAVLQNAGTLPTNRDPVDTRVVQSVQSTTGAIISDPSQVGGWPVLQVGTAPTDSDHDGMPNTWETTNGFNPNLATDGNLDADVDGYPNIEEFLNGTNPRVAEIITFPRVTYLDDSSDQVAQAQEAQKLAKKGILLLTVLCLVTALILFHQTYFSSKKTKKTSKD